MPKQKFSSIFLDQTGYSSSLPPIELQHLLSERGQEVLAVHCERADVQHREVGRKLLQQRAAACIPHL